MGIKRYFKKKNVLKKAFLLTTKKITNNLYYSTGNYFQRIVSHNIFVELLNIKAIFEITNQKFNVL
tara:strand:+ start:126486 stop:126683 length:198 start_codon:yes stop_codon:yes gene_type:complete